MALFPLLIAGLLAGNEIHRSRKESKEIKKEAEKEEAATQEKKRTRRSQIDSLLSQQQSSFLRSGTKLTGTPLEVMADTVRKGEEDLSNIDKNSMAGRLRSQARRTRNAGYGRALATFVSTYVGSGGKIV